MSGFEIDAAMGGEAVPHERVWETEERDDCAVDDFSFSTRVDFVLLFVFVDEDGVEDVTAQFNGMEEDEEPLAAGSEG
jgi:hypothetical protein